MAKNDVKIVHCRYSKCNKLHESTELMKEDAIQGGGKKYYHPDCYRVMVAINEIRDKFIREINPLITKQQVGILIGVINDIVFNKGVSAEQLSFTIDYFIKHKPGALKYPAGLHYAVQDNDAKTAWRKMQDKNTMQRFVKYNFTNSDFVFELPEHDVVDNVSKRTKFSSILGV